MIENIKDFWEAYLEGTGSITIKIHMLVFHTQFFLQIYGTIGFWAEDSVESIHAIANALARRYAALSPEMRATCIFRALAARKTRQAAQLKAKLEGGGSRGSTDFNRKRKRIQGHSSSENEFSAAYSEVVVEQAADEFLEILKSAEDDAANDEGNHEGPVFPKVAMVDCAKCRISAQKDDVQVPDVYLQLHELLFHKEVGEKLENTKKKKSS